MVLVRSALWRKLAPLFFISALGACSGSGPGGSSSTGGKDDTTTGGAPDAGDGSGGGPNRPPMPTVELDSIVIEPADIELVSKDGSKEQTQFKVKGTYSDGTTSDEPSALFAIDSLDLGTLGTSSGKFVAFGDVGGATLVRAHVTREDGKVLEAKANLRVRLTRELVAAGLPPDAGTHFTGTSVDDAARAASIVYPLEGAVMPQNVFPTDIQWLNGVQGDFFRIHLSKPHADVSVIVQHTGAGFGNHYLVDSAAWRALASSDPDDVLKIEVERFEAATSTVIKSPAVSMRFARAALSGSIYYWDIEAGQIRRIDDGTNVAQTFMPTPPVAIGGDVCVGCHSVSPSGRYMSGRLGGGENVGGVFDLTTDLTSSPPPTLFPVVPQKSGGSARWWFSSWSPDEKRMVVSIDEGGLRALAFLDPFTGAAVAASGTMPKSATHPAWSPDGKQIAYTANANNWGGTNTTGDIALLPVLAPDTVGTPQVLHTGASLASSTPAGNADSYPTWSPDSKLIAFAHGNSSRSENGQAALYAMDREGSSVVRLDRACGGPTTVDNFQPRFSPFDEGGYYWVSFLSRRDYGNGEVGTRGTARQQIWVTAIKKDAAPGEDPSQVAYWISGQNTLSRNISAYWAPRACRADGESCSVGSECCGGQCRPDDKGALVCSPPPPEECRQETQTCTNDSDCCDGLSCSDHVCSAPIK